MGPGLGAKDVDCIVNGAGSQGVFVSEAIGQWRVEWRKALESGLQNHQTTNT